MSGGHMKLALPAKTAGTFESAWWIESSDIKYNLRRFYKMPEVQTGVTKARSLSIRNGGLIRTSKAARLGVHPRTLYALRDAGELEQVGRGLNRLAPAPQLTSPASSQ